MIYFFTPYSFRKKLFEAYDDYMKLIPNDDDWGCLMDGDMAFLLSDFGNQIEDYITKFPDTGLFTCYGSRCPYGHQVKAGVNQNTDSIRTIYDNTVRLRQNDHLKVTQINRRIAGHLMVIRKRTWMKYREEIAAHAENANIQAVDTAISDILLKHQEKILLMEGLQVFHYYRQYSMSEKHILSDKLTVVIRTHDRPRAFKRCLESVRRQTHKNIDIVVGVDTPGSLEYVQPYNPTRIVKLQNRERKSHDDFPANAYISTLIEDITDGYILVLDDDNYMADEKGVEKLFARITKEYCIYIIRYRYPDGRLFPNERQFQGKLIENGGVDWASCVFHARFKNVSQSKPLYNGDYHFIKALVDKIKFTEFINLALVHTDTPGNDGKTEIGTNPLTSTRVAAQSATKVKPQPVKRIEGDIDVVYVLGTGSRWNNNEIRFSIRSLVKNLKGFRNIFVVGACPSFLQNVIHIQAEDIFAPETNADGNIIHKVLVACADERISENFLFINDDHIITEPVNVGEIPPFHKGDMMEYAPDFWQLNLWRKRLWRTKNILTTSGLTTYNFDCHTPMLMNKLRFIETMQGFDYANGIGLTMKSLYGNSVYGDAGVQLMGEKKTILRNYAYNELTNLLLGTGFMAFNDQGLTKSLIYWFSKNLPDQSEYETNDYSDKVTDISRWLEGERDYMEGVRLYAKYLNGANMTRMFEEGETPSMRKKLEYKLERTLDDIR